MALPHRPLDRCPVALTLDVIGERWTLLVVRDLLASPARFQDLEESLGPISPSVLSSRLKRLEEAELVERELYSDHPPRAEYRLTAKGRELGAVIEALYRFGSRHLKPRSRGGRAR